MSVNLRRSGILLFGFIIVYLSKNDDLDFLSNAYFSVKKKKYHYYNKYLKNYSYVINNATLTRKLSLINEIFCLYNIRKEIEFYKDISFTNIKLKNYSRVLHPKISLIITVYNQEKFLLKMYSCILNQTLFDIELIFIDDCSDDKSPIIIKKLMNLDKRITYIRNKENKGQFHSRNEGVLLSKGKYILILDPDDFLLNDILIKCYKVAKKFNLDITQFYHIMGNYSRNHFYILNKKSNLLYQPKTKTVFFNNPTRYLWDKLIKKNIFVKSINFMDKKYRKERFVIHNDETACFGIFKIADSYGQLEDIGYFYNRNISNSTTSKNFLLENINGRFHCIFNIMEYYYDKSSYSRYEIINGGYKFFTYRILRKYEDKIPLLTEGFDYINKVINIYLNCSFLNSAQKILLKEFQLKVNLRKLNITKAKNFH